MDKVVIGIDQSYQDTGITITVNGIVIKVFSIKYDGCKNNTEKRIYLKNKLDLILLKVIAKYGIELPNKSFDTQNIICIIERIRLKSQGFINIDYIRGMGALNSVIIDTMYSCKIKTYSVDTRAWKSSIVGTSKPKKNKYKIDPEKFPTIIWCIKHGYMDHIIDYNVGRKKNGVINKNGKSYMYDDNKADSICISLYGFLPVKKQKLQEEH